LALGAVSPHRSGLEAAFSEPRREAPVDRHRALEFVQGLNKGFLHLNVEEPFVLFEPLAEGCFPRGQDSGDEEVHDVSLAGLFGVGCGCGGRATDPKCLV